MIVNEFEMEFPCEFPIKAMGRASSRFRAEVVEIVERHTGFISEHAVRTVTSRNGNYLSVTVLITAVSRQQLDKIYQDLTSSESVIMAL